MLCMWLGLSLWQSDYVGSLSAANGQIITTTIVSDMFNDEVRVEPNGSDLVILQNTFGRCNQRQPGLAHKHGQQNTYIGSAQGRILCQ